MQQTCSELLELVWVWMFTVTASRRCIPDAFEELHVFGHLFQVTLRAACVVYKLTNVALNSLEPAHFRNRDKLRLRIKWS